jgi:asparagine synthase (glutamine-hydrolysing)
MIVLVSKNQSLIRKLQKFIVPKNIIFCNKNYLIAQTSSESAHYQSNKDNIFQAIFSPSSYSSARKNEYSQDTAIKLLLDKKIDKLSIQRDKIGFQHLYFTKIPAGVLISNSLRILAKIKKLLGEVNSFSKTGITSYLTFQYVAFPETIVKGISQVPPGGKLIVDESLTSEVKTGWLNISSIKDSKSGNTLSIAKDIKDLFINSLQRNTNDFRRIGCYLSGGMDTSTNVALLVKELDIRPIAFTADFAEPQYSEIADAEVISNKFGLKHFVTTITPEDVFLLPDIVNKFDSPIADRAILPQYFVAKKAKEMNVETIISGEGGDEIFGYPRRLSDTQGETIVKQRELSNLSLARYYLGFAGLFNRNEIRILSGNSGTDVSYGEQLAKIYKTIQLKDNFDKIYLGQWKSWLIDNVLVKDKGICEPMGIKSANPFIDIKIMELMASLPLGIKLILLRNKYLLRTIMADYLPKRIIQKKKHKFHVPLAKWFRKPLYEFLHESLLSTNSIVASMFERTFVEQLIRNHKCGVQDNNRKLWALLLLENWILSFRNLEKSAKMLKYLD